MRALLSAFAVLVFGCDDTSMMRGPDSLGFDGAHADGGAMDMARDMTANDLFRDDMSFITDGCAFEPSLSSSSSAGNLCLNGSDGCAPPEVVPPATVSFGAECGVLMRCCVWFLEAPKPFVRWENCGDGWTCAGERCKAVCQDMN